MLLIKYNACNSFSFSFSLSFSHCIYLSQMMTNLNFPLRLFQSSCTMGWNVILHLTYNLANFQDSTFISNPKITYHQATILDIWCFVEVKFRYSKKVRKIQPIFNFLFDITYLSLVFLLISNLISWLRLHQFLGTKTTEANEQKDQALVVSSNG